MDQLRSGIKDGSLQSVLFPTDIIANAPRILADMGRIFPVQTGTFLIGPMAKLGWGTPALVTLQVGVILQLPRPVIITVGILRVALPVDEAPLVVLQVNFAGTVDFASGQLEFDASLFDSRILSFTLSGDMAVRVYWKENANLLLSVGGFHPSYTPPPMNLRPMQRLAMVLFPRQSARPRRGVSGRDVEHASVRGPRRSVLRAQPFQHLRVSRLRHLDSDKPFHFIAEIVGMVAVRTGSHVLFSIQIQLTLEGPVPLHAHGTGSFEIGFSFFSVTISVSFDVTIDTGAIARRSRTDRRPGPPRRGARTSRELARASPGGPQRLGLHAQDDATPDGTLILQPAGTLEISQKIAPLNVDLQRLGGNTPDAPGAFRIQSVNFGDTAPPLLATKEEFAPAQFFDMSDAEKLSRPSFAQYDAGVTIGEEIGPKTDFMQTREVSYEVIYVPEHQPTPRFRYARAPVVLLPRRVGGRELASLPGADGTVAVERVGRGLGGPVHGGLDGRSEPARRRSLL